MGSSKIQRILHNPALLFLTLGQRGFFNWMSDEQYLKIAYRIRMGKKLDLDNPKTFNEKLQWLKLHDRRPEYTQMVDKIEAKKLVAKAIGEEYIIPTLGVWNHFDEIDFAKLPDQFVLKCSHDSGGLVICRDKSKLDKVAAKKKIEACLKHNFYWGQREWPYKNVKPRILAEPYLTDGSGELPDYKVHSFNGVPKVILVCRDRFADSGLTEDFYTTAWEHLDVKRPEHSNAIKPDAVPGELAEMVELSQKLSEHIPFLRTDFYTIDHKLYFGELTFFPSSGFAGFEPKKYDKILGDWVALPIRGGVLLTKDNKHILLTSQSIEGELQDYKFFCFGGKVKFFKVDFGRFTNHRANYYDINGEQMLFGEADYLFDVDHHIDMPANLKEMIQIAEQMAGDHPFIRVDLYNIFAHIYVGELTFYPASGFGRFEPSEWDEKLGAWIELSAVNGRKD